MSYCDVTNPKLGQMHPNSQTFSSRVKFGWGIHLLYPLYEFLKTWTNAMGDVNMEWRHYSTAFSVYNIFPTSHIIYSIWDTPLYGLTGMCYMDC